MHVLEYDGELARLMNRKWLGQSWALGSSNRTVNDELERSRMGWGAERSLYQISSD